MATVLPRVDRKVILHLRSSSLLHNRSLLEPRSVFNCWVSTPHSLGPSLVNTQSSDRSKDDARNLSARSLQGVPSSHCTHPHIHPEVPPLRVSTAIVLTETNEA
eukprot:jgi/Chrzof1/10194/Cz04g32080.t1